MNPSERAQISLQNGPHPRRNSELIGDVALASALASILKDHSKLGLRLNEIPFDWKTEHHRLKGKLFCIAFADGFPVVQDLVEYHYDCLIPYCLPKKLLNKALEETGQRLDYTRIVRLGDEAKALFIQGEKSARVRRRAR